MILTHQIVNTMLKCTYVPKTMVLVYLLHLKIDEQHKDEGDLGAMLALAMTKTVFFNNDITLGLL